MKSIMRCINSVGVVVSATCALALAQGAAAQEGVGSFSRTEGNPTAVCGNLAYVTNSYSNTLSVIDWKEERLVQNIKTGNAPVNPTFSRDWTKLYFANVEDGTLTIINARTAKVERTIQAGLPKPSGLQFLPDGRHLVISFLGATVSDAGSLGIMDLQTGKLVKTIPVQGQPERFAITPDGKKAYVANIGANSVSVVDLDSGVLVATILTEALPFNVLMNRRGDRVFVGNVRGDSISEIDTATNRVVSTIPAKAGPNGMTLTTDGFNILITNIYAGTMQYYNLSMKTMSEPTFVGLLPGFVRLAPDGSKGMFVRPYGRHVTVFDGNTLAVGKNIETGIGPTTVAMCGNP